MIREVTKEDVIVVAALGIDFDSSFITLDKPLTKNVAFLIEQEIVGFINYALLYERAEIDYLYVKQEYRNKGIATKLLEWCLKDCQNEDVEEISLEVRVSNISAIRLYKNMGFEKIGIRKQYYENEDAHIMRRLLVIK